MIVRRVVRNLLPVLEFHNVTAVTLHFPAFF
jgi:hypothetical protein